MSLTTSDAADSSARSVSHRALTVAITGASGTVGPALLERLANCDAVGELRILARRRTNDMPADVDFRPVDVRDAGAVAGAVAGADVVVHLAYALYGLHPGERQLFATNGRGTRHVAQAAANAGARRFVYLSSAAVYGVHADNPRRIPETSPIRAEARHFYARHKAQTEIVVQEALAGSQTQAYVFRPCGIVGPHAAGGTMSGLPAAVALPAAVPALHWPALVTQPILVETTKAVQELGWRPRFDSAAALRATREALAW